MKELLFKKLLVFGEDSLVLAPINILIILGIFFVAWLARKYFLRGVENTNIKSPVIQRRKNLISKIGAQAIILIAIISAIESFNINNDHINFSNFLDVLLFRAGAFELRIYNIVFAFVLFFIAHFTLNIFKYYLHNYMSKSDWMDEGREFTIFQLTRYFIYTLVIISIIKSTGVELDILLASSAALLVGIGFGLQSVFADFVSGFVLFFDGSVKVGEVIEMENTFGRVEEINIRTSRVRTFDGSLLIVPNSKLTTNTIDNMLDMGDPVRFEISVGVAYGSDTRLVEKLLIEAAKDHPKVVKKPEPNVAFVDFGDSSLDFKLYIFLDDKMKSPRIKSDVRFKIDELFREHNIQIPFPQRDLHIKSNPQN